MSTALPSSEQPDPAQAVRFTGPPSGGVQTPDSQFTDHDVTGLFRAAAATPPWPQPPTDYAH